MRVCLVVVLLLGVLAAPAAADTEPLPAGTTVVPRDGQAWTALGSQTFVAYIGDYDELPDELAFAVASDPATGPDGLLAHPIARYAAPVQPGHPGIYAASPGLGTPGTYYWQATYADDEEDDVYASEVRTLTVVAPPPPDVPQPVIPYLPPPAAPPAATPRPPDARTVRIAVRRAIHRATHMVGRRIVYRCAPTPAAATCKPSWRDVRYRYRGTLRLTFGASTITATFRGRRVPRGHGHARAVTWATTV
jgi:hypothetical protein